MILAIPKFNRSANNRNKNYYSYAYIRIFNLLCKTEIDFKEKQNGEIQVIEMPKKFKSL